jgi:catalase
MYRYDPTEDPTDDCFRAGGNLWRVMTEDKKEILIQNTANDIAPCTENIKYRHAVHCYLADHEYGRRFVEAAGLDMKRVIKLSELTNKELNQSTLDPKMK